MKKIIFVSFFLCSKIAFAQYFIPLFQPELDTVASTLLISDSTNNYLYLSTGDNFFNGRLYAYQNNSIQQIGSTLINDEFRTGDCNSNGSVGLVTYNTDLYSIDSLTFQSCIYNNCNNYHAIKMISKNDTFYFYDDVSKIKFLSPTGNVITIGTTNGSGPSDLIDFNSQLYACGSFTSINGNNQLKYISRWDGNNWQIVDESDLDSIYGGIGYLINFNSKLYMIGSFNLVNGIQTHELASYDGTNWFAEPGLGSNSFIGAWEVYHNKIWMSGILHDNFGGLQCFGSYDANSQFKLINNTIPFTSSSIQSMAVFNDTLFIGGGFNSVGFIPAHHIVKFVDNSFSSFAPVGTKWWYNSSDSGASFSNSAYSYYEVTRDTFIMHTANYNGYNCRKIIGEHHHHDSTVTVLQPLYVYGDTNRIMYYNNYQGRFIPLYLFNVITGDTLTYYTPQPQSVSDTTFRVVVDSITQLNIQGNNYKRVWTEPLDNWSFGNDGYVQLVGGMGTILPQSINYFTNEGPLRCYQDTSVFYQYLVNINCEQLDTVTGINNLSLLNSQLFIFPNPVTSIATIENQTTQSGKSTLTVENCLGQIILSTEITNNKKQNIDMSNCASGMYFIKCFDGKQQLVIKVVKN